ncbi:MAG: type II toxin-antitoxin system mRNA interferase toxin, RelE/StbE family [Gammaproteobacteria bacterium]|nr:MAG: type II toxin-antitoxin system mRNA interferase toxin, RelE/StbE family [Gammaproteobacteria bacterium]
MAKYSLVFKKSVAKDLRKIPNNDVEKIINKINSLKINPRAYGCIKLSNQNRYRTRQGLYRILYEIKDVQLVVHVVKIAHRQQAYSNL